MPRCGATFDENSVPPWTRGDFRGGFECGNKLTPTLRATDVLVRSVADEHGTPTPAERTLKSTPPRRLSTVLDCKVSTKDKRFSIRGEFLLAFL